MPGRLLDLWQVLAHPQQVCGGEGSQPPLQSSGMALYLSHAECASATPASDRSKLIESDTGSLSAHLELHSCQGSNQVCDAHSTPPRSAFELALQLEHLVGREGLCTRGGAWLGIQE